MPDILSVLQPRRGRGVDRPRGRCADPGCGPTTSRRWPRRRRSDSGDRDVPGSRWRSPSRPRSRSSAESWGRPSSLARDPCRRWRWRQCSPGRAPASPPSLAVTEKKWGTELNWACKYTRIWARDVDSYDIVVTTKDGAQTAVGSWKPAGDEATGLSAATSIPTSEIRSVDIRVTGTDQPLAVSTL